ncbi:MAG TPA: M20/M25/M40 family metallo-hydrolase [Vicinamibacterales bacterium]|nr:M20/M25/M40 family metallo-hydrolase [Vicinamibacterales bacterium]
MNSRCFSAACAAAVWLSWMPIDAAPQALSGGERAAVAYVDAHADEAIALLERVVNINSGTMNLEGVRRVGRVFEAEFKSLAFETEWVDGSKWQRAGHLIARHPGKSAKVLLIGHLDTVFEADSPFQAFERLDASTAKGPGIMDMKGGDVIIVQTLKALKAAGLLDAMNITVVMTGDEEAAGRPLKMARAALVEAAQGARVAIGFEDGDGDPTHAVIARRGTTGWDLTVTGTPGHSSQIFTEALGAGAIYEAARILDAFRTQLREPYLTYNPGVIVGGTTTEYDAALSRGTGFGKSNVIAEHARVTGDLRALSPEQFERAKAKMQQIVSASLPKTKAEIVFDEGYPPLAPTDGNERLLTMFDRASRDLGLGGVTAVSPDKAGAADISFIAGIPAMCMDAAGMKGRDGHTVNETADLPVLAVQAKRMAVLLARLAQDGGR